MFKKGDWVIHDYEIAQVRGVKDGRVTEVSTGSFCTIGSDLTVFPLTLRTKVIAESFEYCADELRKLPGESHFNWPDIHGRLCELCAEACLLPPVKKGAQDHALRNVYENGRKFVEAIKAIAERHMETAVDGIKVLRQ